MTPRRKMAALALVWALLGGAALLNWGGEGGETLAFLGDSEWSAARFTGEVPIATCAVFWADARNSNDALRLVGQNHRFRGCIHSNRDVDLGGGNGTFERTIRFVNNWTTNDNGHTLKAGVVKTQPQDYPFPFHIAEYAPTGCKARQAAAQGQYYSYVAGNVQLKGATLKPGLHYVRGHATVDLTGFGGDVTIVATGTLKVSTDRSGARAYVDDLLFFAEGAGPNALSVVGNGGTVEGALYAPKGEAAFTGNSNRYVGQIMGHTISVGGAGSTFEALSPVGVPRC